jgi:hypothetical protein
MLKRTPLKRGNSQLKRTPLKKGKKLGPGKKSEDELNKERYERDKMNSFWIFIGDNTPNISEISGGWIPKYSKLTMHHLIYKSMDKNLKYSLSNILRCTGDEHADIHSNPDKYPLVQNKIKFIMNNYEDCCKESLTWELNYENGRVLYKQ